MQIIDRQEAAISIESARRGRTIRISRKALEVSRLLQDFAGMGSCIIATPAK